MCFSYIIKCTRFYCIWCCHFGFDCSFNLITISNSSNKELLEFAPTTLLCAKQRIFTFIRFSPILIIFFQNFSKKYLGKFHQKTSEWILDRKKLKNFIKSSFPSIRDISLFDVVTILTMFCLKLYNYCQNLRLEISRSFLVRFTSSLRCWNRLTKTVCHINKTKNKSNIKHSHS